MYLVISKSYHLNNRNKLLKMSTGGVVGGLCKTFLKTAYRQIGVPRDDIQNTIIAILPKWRK